MNEKEGRFPETVVSAGGHFLNRWDFLLFEPIFVFLFLTMLLGTLLILRRRKKQLNKFVLPTLLVSLTAFAIMIFTLFIFYLRGKNEDLLGEKCLVQYFYLIQEKEKNTEKKNQMAVSVFCLFFDVFFSSLIYLPSVLINVAILLFSAPM
jgi:ABC-type multidrug transport system permease subunit